MSIFRIAPAAALALLPAVLPLACPTTDGDGPTSEGEGEANDGEGEANEGEGEGEGEANEGEGEGEAGVGEGEGEGEGEGGGGGACGNDVVDGSTITGTEGIVVGRDGSIYYSQNGAVGRRSPDGTVDDAWSDLPAGLTTVYGVMLSPDNTRLYAASPNDGTVYVVDVASGAVLFDIGGFRGANGLTVDGDGTLFVSAFSDGAVFGVDVGDDEAGSTIFTVTTAVDQPNGVLVDGDDLLVLSYATGELFRAAGGRTGPATSTTAFVGGLGNPDGIVRADDGTLFVTDNGLGMLLHVDGAVVTAVDDGIGAAANLEFGTAPLSCTHLLVTSSNTLRVVDVGVGPAPVPWR